MVDNRRLVVNVEPVQVQVSGLVPIASPTVVVRLRCNTDRLTGHNKREAQENTHQENWLVLQSTTVDLLGEHAHGIYVIDNHRGRNARAAHNRHGQLVVGHAGVPLPNGHVQIRTIFATEWARVERNAGEKIIMENLLSRFNRRLVRLLRLTCLFGLLVEVPVVDVIINTLNVFARTAM